MKAPDMSVYQPKIAAVDNTEAIAQGDMEARLRRKRGGAANDILTSAVGIPSTRTLGGVAA
jgi:predicted nucleic acid-binding protein